MELIEGEWYTDDDRFYYRYKKNNTYRNIIVSEFINNFNRYFKKDENLTLGTNIRHITDYSEILPFLPKDHILHEIYNKKSNYIYLTLILNKYGIT